MKRKAFSMLTAALAVLASLPGPARADRCEDVYRDGDRSFRAARQAADKKRYGRAARLYEEAGRYYLRVAAMKKCSCPALAANAGHNAGMCRSSAELMRQKAAAAEGPAARAGRRSPAPEESAAGHVRAWAEEEYRRGEEAARNGQWDEAVRSFEEAAGLWDSLASNDADDGREAREAAELARDNKGQ